MAVGSPDGSWAENLSEITFSWAKLTVLSVAATTNTAITNNKLLQMRFIKPLLLLLFTSYLLPE
jgi:hypothetical protein